MLVNLSLLAVSQCARINLPSHQKIIVWHLVACEQYHTTEKFLHAPLQNSHYRATQCLPVVQFLSYKLLFHGHSPIWFTLCISYIFTWYKYGYDDHFDVVHLHHWYVLQESVPLCDIVIQVYSHPV